VRTPYLRTVALAVALLTALGLYFLDPFSWDPSSELTSLDSNKPDPLSVLFIGNSFTSTGPLPAVFGRLVRAGNAGRGLKVRMVASPGVRLVDLEKSAGEAISGNGPWTHVVLQDQSRIAWTDADTMRLGIEHINAHVHAARAETVLLMTWADASETPRDQDVIAAAYTKIGHELDASVAPVGRAWSWALIRPRLYQPDGHHPSGLGVYLTACVVYCTVLRKSPVGLPYTSHGPRPSEQDLRSLQELAVYASGI
jgi:hypothetical protein